MIFTANMVTHLVVVMVAPLGLVMALLISLVLKCLPNRWGRLWLWLVSNSLVRLVSHPITAALVSVGVMSALHLSHLYGHVMRSPSVAWWLNWHFFTWTIACPEPAPKQPTVSRVFVLVCYSSPWSRTQRFRSGCTIPSSTSHTT